MEKIRVEDLTFSYDKERNPLRQCPLRLEEGSYTTIIGHNGSGKSTIAKLLIGLLDKDRDISMWMVKSDYGYAIRYTR